MKILSIAVFIIGLCNGSFFNCLVYRSERGMPLISSFSKCDDCGHRLKPEDLFPLLSWIFLKGRCRYCGKKISVRYPLTELFCAGAYLSLFIRFGFDDRTLVYLILFSALFIISLYDLDTYEIPLVPLVIPFVCWLVSDIPENKTVSIAWATTIALFIFFVSLIMKKISEKDCLGFGDVELIFVIALYLGFYKSVWCLLLASVSGILFSLVRKKEMIPFGPSLSIACFVLLFF